MPALKIADQINGDIMDIQQAGVGKRRSRTRQRVKPSMDLSPAATSSTIADQTVLDRQGSMVSEARARTNQKASTETKGRLSGLAILPEPAAHGLPVLRDPCVPGGEARARTNLKASIETSARLSGLATLCAHLVDRQRQRTFCIKQQSRADRAIDSYIARLLNFHTGLPEADRKKIFATAAAIRKAAERGEDQDAVDHQTGTVLAACRPLILASAIGRKQWDALRDEAETAMCDLARRLPVWPWVKTVKGLAELGLAVIVGEAGRPLHDYRSHQAFWKRMGLAVIDGKRQGAPGAGATAEDWIRHGYNRHRRSEAWNFCGDKIIYAQWRGERCAICNKPTAKCKCATPELVPAHAIGPYGEVYGTWKAMYLERGWDKKHADDAARRKMSKDLLRHLLREWRQLSPK